MTNPAVSFSPTEIWTPNSENFELEDYILQAIYEMNQENPEKVIHDLKQKVERSPNGIVLAVLEGNKPQEYSKTEALALFNPHANELAANALVKAELVRRAAEKADVRDNDGRLKPVVAIAAAGGKLGSNFEFTAAERRQIRDGELGPVAKEYMLAISWKGIGKVALSGFSEGGDMTLAAVRKAKDSNLDVTSMAAGDIAGVEVRSWPILGFDFLKSGLSFQAAIDASGVEAQKKAIGPKPWSVNRNKDFARFGLVAVTNKTNRDLWGGLTRNRFESQMDEILSKGLVDKAVIGYGGEEDTITKPRAIEPSIHSLYQEFGPESFMSIKVEGATHAWGDRLPLLVKLYMRALK